MAQFRFVTIWRFRAHLDEIWTPIHDYERWPSWWKGVERVDVVRPGGPDGVGTRTEQTWKSALPYRLRFNIEITRVVPFQVIDVAADGELRGTGRMSFSTDRDEVAVRFEWNVETTRVWMNLLAPLARPLFRWNHGTIMNWGAQCLGRRLGVPLLESRDVREASQTAA